MLKLFLLLSLLIFGGCSRDPDYGAADDRIICDLLNGNAFYVKANVGQTSFVKRAEQYDDLCKARK